MYNPKEHGIKPFEKNLYLASPTIHRNTDSYDELKFIQEAFDTNWLSTVGANINECKRMIAEKVGVKYAFDLSCGTAALHLALKLAGVKRGAYRFLLIQSTILGIWIRWHWRKRLSYTQKHKKLLW